ncbi:MAG: hypothetical protein AAGH41_11950 [Pseudomonadota bacterium]
MINRLAWAGLAAALSIAACASPTEGPALERTFQPRPGTSTDFTFQSEGQTLSGIFDTPTDGEAEALIIFVHGYGPTDIRNRPSFRELRSRFNALGIATALWDKPGQGQSEGTFDINQSVYASAREVVDAAAHFRAVRAPGAERIGIWGISRAGWIAPIAMSEDDDLSFWISVSGTTAEDNFPYLLLSNLPFEGGTEEEAAALGAAWREGCRLYRTGGSYDAYRQVMQPLIDNAYITRMRGGWQTRAQYEASQKSCSGGTCTRTDNDMCAYVFIEEFGAMLSSLDVDTLAVFGERDLNIDWRKTHELYEATLGSNPQASLAVEVFPGVDHNINPSETGSLREMQTMGTASKPERFFTVQEEWLESVVLIQGAREED